MRRARPRPRKFHSGPAYRHETAGMHGRAAVDCVGPQESYVMANEATVLTLEGPIRYAAGSVLTEGPAGELYAFSREYMAAHYRAAGPEVVAEVPEGLSSLAGMRASGAVPGFLIFKHAGAGAAVTAYHMPHPFSVVSASGHAMSGIRGGYLMEADRDGACSRWAIDGDVFRSSYTFV